MTRPITIKSPNVGKTVDTLINANQSKKIRPVLEGLGVAECVIKEWLNEAHRRRVVHAQSARLNNRRQANRVLKPGQFKRRIIRSVALPGYKVGTRVLAKPREFEFHATKGLRSYAIPGAGYVEKKTYEQAYREIDETLADAGF